ncbi:unnamed protein product, partial [Adineta ricciae]
LQREIEGLDKYLWLVENGQDRKIDLTMSNEDWNEVHDCVTVERRRPASSDEPDSGIELPFGWIKQWSEREEQFYYFNTHTKESRWKPPN